MRAWQLTAFGRENIKLNEVPQPEPGPGEVLVRVRAVSLNYRDKLLYDGLYNPRLEFPKTQVADAAGEVVGLGEGTKRFKPGDRVITQYATRWIDGPAQGKESLYTLGNVLDGALAEYLVLDENALVAVPEYLTDEEAASIPCAGVTAWQALMEKGNLQPGETVLVQGTGGVSLFGLQIAHAVGAHVIVTSSSDEKLARARELGADQTVNYKTTPEWEKEVLALTNKAGVQHVLETVGGNNLARSVRALRPEGNIYVIGVIEGANAELPLFTVMQKVAHIHGITTGPRVALERMLARFGAWKIHPVIDTVYSFEEAPAAFEHLERGAFGKIVIRVQ